MIDSGNNEVSWRLLAGDCSEVLDDLPEGTVDLVYADPPFATNQVQKGRSDRLAYDDRWPDLDSYLSFMAARLTQLHRVLAPDGAILLHVDWRSSHHLRVLLQPVAHHLLAPHHQEVALHLLAPHHQEEALHRQLPLLQVAPHRQ